MLLDPDLCAASPPLLIGHGSPRPGAQDGLSIIDEPPRRGFYLEHDDDCLRLRHADAPATDRGITVDFDANELRRRLDGARKSLLARALGLHRHPGSTILDTTCGLGRDSATLAAAGARLTSLERHPALFLLVADARRRALASDPPPIPLAHWTAHHHADATAWLGADRERHFDAIYIDPMFTATRRKARPRKAMAWMHELIGPDTDVPTLLEYARARARRQVVIKQHARTEPIGRPTRQIDGKAIRFDIYSTLVEGG